MVEEDTYLCKATEEGKRVFNNMFDAFANNSSEAYIKKQLKGTGLSYVAQGASRIVLLDESGDYLNAKYSCVVKIEKNGEVGDNQTEVYNWNRIEGGAKDYLMTITDYDENYRWLVQPYADSEVTDEMVLELKKEFIRHGWKAKDANKRNCVRVQDRAVLVDYGNGIVKLDFDEMSKEEHLAVVEWGMSDTL